MVSLATLREMLNRAEVDELLRHDDVDTCLRRTVGAIFQAYDVTAAYCSAEFDDAEETNLAPFYRRAKLEGAMRSAAQLVPAAETVVVGPDDSDGNWWRHTEVRVGGLVFTACSVQKPCGRIEGAEFRSRLAMLNEDPRLAFNDVDLSPEREGIEDRAYGVVLHSRCHYFAGVDERDRRRLPGSIYLAFPTADLSSYRHEVDLLERYSTYARRFLPKSWTEEAHVSYRTQSRKQVA